MKKDSYFRFIFRKGQALDWLVIFASVALGCLFVTRTYPYPRVMSDSYGYIWTAMKDQFTYLRPFGYSAFLQLLHHVSVSVYSVIVSQALVYAISLSLLTLAVKKYWPPRKVWIFRAFEVVVALSPAAIFMLNTILSDTLQSSLVFVLVAMMLVMVHENSWTAVIIYTLALFASFHTRYTSVFFPIAFIPILAVKGKTIMRVSSILLTVAAFMIFHEQRTRSMTRLVLQRQYSTGFEGWQLANNAIHVIPFIDKDDSPETPEVKRVRELHQFVLRYEMANNKILEKTDSGKKATAAFIWDYDSPLKQHMIRVMGEKNYAVTWVNLGTGVFKEYGKWLIVHYPWLFVKYYLWPNSSQVFFTTRNEVVCGHEEIPAGKSEIVEWFDLPFNKDFSPRGDAYGKVFRPLLPWIELLTWMVFLASAVMLFLVGKPRTMSRDTRLSLWVLFLFGLVYYGTVTFASPVALRYWMPMHAVKLVFAWIAVSESLRSLASRARR